ncbi:hypothetical protein ACQ4PT_054538 [Festuca glaucescens]
MASSKKVVTRDEWERKLRDVKIRKEDMDRLVMNFLVTEGFVDAADRFRLESGTQCTVCVACTLLTWSPNVFEFDGKLDSEQAFLKEIEKTVALLVFEDVENCPYGELLDISHRLKTANEVNTAILTSQSHEKDPKLTSLLKMLIWTQDQLDEKAAYPRINNFSTAALEDLAI